MFLADDILQYTHIAVQLANLTATVKESLVHTFTKKKAPAGNKSVRPKATEVVGKTKGKMDELKRRMAVKSDAKSPSALIRVGEADQLEQPAEEK